MRLPWCEYPTAVQIERHGLQPLPPSLPVADLAAAHPYRSAAFRVTRLRDLSVEQQLEMARIMAESFAQREPMLRFLRLAQLPPVPLAGHLHSDPLGTHEFGPWQKDTLFGWLIRVFFLTDPTSSATAIRMRTDVQEQSLAIVDADGHVIGGAINETMPHGQMSELREPDPVIAALLTNFEAIFAMLGEQEHASIHALEQHSPAFHQALGSGRVGHHVLVARSSRLPTEDALELVAGTVEHYRDLGFEYILTSAVNQWTGAAATLLGGIPVHFEPYLSRRRLAASAVPLDIPSSLTGMLSNKDSGSMLYVIRLR